MWTTKTSIGYHKKGRFYSAFLFFTSLGFTRSLIELISIKEDCMKSKFRYFVRFNPDKFKKVYKSIGMTQESLGEALGVSRRAVSQWIHSCEIPVDAYFAFLDLFGMLDYDEINTMGMEIESDLFIDI